jgi:hypothetical protein
MGVLALGKSAVVGHSDAVERRHIKPQRRDGRGEEEQGTISEVMVSSQQWQMADGEWQRRVGWLGKFAEGGVNGRGAMDAETDKPRALENASSNDGCFERPAVCPVLRVRRVSAVPGHMPRRQRYGLDRKSRFQRRKAGWSGGVVESMGAGRPSARSLQHFDSVWRPD